MDHRAVADAGGRHLCESFHGKWSSQTRNITVFIWTSCLHLTLTWSLCMLSWARARWHGLKITLLYFKAASRYRIKSWYLEISSRTLHKCRTGWQKSNITIFVTKCFDISINPRRILCTHYWQLFWDTLMRVTRSWARCCFGRMFQEMLEIQQHSYGDQAVIWVLSQPSLSGCCLHTVNHHFVS